MEKRNEEEEELRSKDDDVADEGKLCPAVSRGDAPHNSSPLEDMKTSNQHWNKRQKR